MSVLSPPNKRLPRKRVRRGHLRTDGLTIEELRASQLPNGNFAYLSVEFTTSQARYHGDYRKDSIVWGEVADVGDLDLRVPHISLLLYGSIDQKEPGVPQDKLRSCRNDFHDVEQTIARETGGTRVVGRSYRRDKRHWIYSAIQLQDRLSQQEAADYVAKLQEHFHNVRIRGATFTEMILSVHDVFEYSGLSKEKLNYEAGDTLWMPYKSGLAV